jgi:microsomal dipeptidase-like Zn-dependent dipeptidase
LQHIAEVLDQHGLFAWGSTAIGSDFDGTINPLKGIWTAEDLPLLADQLLLLAENYLKGNNKLTLLENKTITAEEIIQNFTIGNTLTFLKNNF